MHVDKAVDGKLFSRDDLIFAYAIRSGQYSALNPAAIIAAIEAAKDAADKADYSNWQNSVSSKLDEISAKLDEVLADLRDLKVWMPKALDDETKKMWSTGIVVDRQMLDGVIAGMGHKPDQYTIQRLTAMLQDVQKTTLSLACWPNYGFSHFNEVATGTITTYVAMKLVHISDAERDTFLRQIIDYFNGAISPDIPTSIMSAANLSATDVVGRDADLNGLLNKWWTFAVYRRNVNHGGDPYTEYTDSYIMVSGTPSSGIAGTPTDSSFSTVNNDQKYPFYPGPHGSTGAVTADIGQRLAQRAQAVTNTDKLNRYVADCHAIAEKLTSMLSPAHKPK